MRRNKQHQGDIFRDEEGFTTTSMVLSLLLTLALLFTSAQVYRINSASAEVQNVADAAALAAENQVAEFMVVAQFCDAVVLSLSLTGIATCGLGIAALCTPATATMSVGLIKAGEKIIETRNNFATRAKSALDKLQKALPYLSAASAVGVAQANNDDSTGANYLGVVVLVPDKGKPIQVDVNDSADKLLDDVGNQAADIREKAKEAEDASKQANEAKQRAFKHDCGDNPNYCMYERAARLAGMSGLSNPLYSSVDTWSFSVALERAKRYYGNRAENEEPTGNSPGDITRWKLRLCFYDYALDLLEREGYVRETDDSFSANFPHLPKNTSEMRGTKLYTDKDFPISEEPNGEFDEDGEEGTMPVMHSWPGCPGATGEIYEYNSLYYQETANLTICPVCELSAVAMGKVAAASTSISNGFEYHYEVVAREAELYQKERALADGAKSEVKSKVNGLLDKLIDTLKDVLSNRIDVSPPGTAGAIALVVNKGSTPAGFTNRLVASGGSLGTRAAVSASTLLDEGSEDGRTAINSMLDGLKQDGGVAVGAAGVVLDVWSKLLMSYSDGIDALTGGIEKGLNQMPLSSASGLGTWAGAALRATLKTVGLEPAKINSLKAVLVNSAHVAAEGEGQFATGLIKVKQRVIAHPLYSADLFSSLITDAERQVVSQVEGLGDSIQIASIELCDGGPSIPITIPLPEEAKRFGVGMVRSFLDRLRSVYVETREVRMWE